MTEYSLIHTADAVQILMENEGMEHLRKGVWIYFQIPFARDIVYQGYITNVEPVDANFTRVTLIPYGEPQKALDAELHPGLNSPETNQED